MAEKEIVETSEAEIAVHWQEEDYVYPSRDFIAQANMTDGSIYQRFSLDNFPNCFKEYADLLDWFEYWDTILDTSDAPCFKWFAGGKINASYNCIDRHLAKNKNKTAIHYVPEPLDEKYEHVTYQELYVRVNEFAALLQDFCGLKAGDRVTLHMPMSVELPITMLACAQVDRPYEHCSVSSQEGTLVTHAVCGPDLGERWIRRQPAAGNPGHV